MGEDLSKTPPRGPAADVRHRSDRGWNNGRGRDDYYNNNHASPSPRRGRYKDWDREDRSPPHSRSRSRSRSPQRSRRLDHDLAPNREIMMEGLGPHMTEDDVRALPS